VPVQCMRKNRRMIKNYVKVRAGIGTVSGSGVLGLTGSCMTCKMRGDCLGILDLQ